MGRSRCLGWRRDACFGPPVGARFDDSGFGRLAGGLDLLTTPFAATSHCAAMCSVRGGRSDFFMRHILASEPAGNERGRGSQALGVELRAESISATTCSAAQRRASRFFGEVIGRPTTRQSAPCRMASPGVVERL